VGREGGEYTPHTRVAKFAAHNDPDHRQSFPNPSNPSNHVDSMSVSVSKSVSVCKCTHNSSCGKPVHMPGNTAHNANYRHATGQHTP
jgi:hypothetical protein